MPFDFELSDPTIVRLGITLLIILGFFMVSRIVLRIIPKYIEDHTRRYRTSKIIKRSAATAAIICIIIVISPGTTEFLTVLTLIGAGLAIALREVLLCLFGWANLTFSAVYKQGDRIEINGVCGDVIDIRILRSTMMEIRNWVDADQSTGRIVHIPNSWTLQHAVYNYSHGFNFIWNEIPFTVTFRSDWDAAQEIMLSLAQVSADIVEEQAKEEMHRSNPHRCSGQICPTPTMTQRSASPTEQFNKSDGEKTHILSDRTKPAENPGLLPIDFYLLYCSCR